MKANTLNANLAFISKPFDTRNQYVEPVSRETQYVDGHFYIPGYNKLERFCKLNE